MWKPTVLALALASLAGCVIEQPVRVDEPVPRPQPVYVPAPAPAAPAVVSVVVDPPISQPPPVACPWAPPPMLVEVPPPSPAPDAVWVGGYWVWQGTWVWAHGHWAFPPRPAYHWVEPYYEHRDGLVIFIAGHWGAPGAVFVPPAWGMHIDLATVRYGVTPGPRPWGPNGVFVPAPPGSRPGIIVPAPIGTPPAVVVSAPPVVNVGMRVQANVNSNNTTVINNITHVTNITQVTVIAPPSATATGQSVHAVVPAQAHLAAALPPVVKAYAPPPLSPHPVPTSVAARPAAGAGQVPLGPVAAPQRTAPVEREDAEARWREPGVAPASRTTPARSNEEREASAHGESQFDKPLHGSAGEPRRGLDEASARFDAPERTGREAAEAPPHVARAGEGPRTAVREPVPDTAPRPPAEGHRAHAPARGASAAHGDERGLEHGHEREHEH